MNAANDDRPVSLGLEEAMVRVENCQAGLLQG